MGATSFSFPSSSPPPGTRLDFLFATQFRRLQISTGESPAYSKYRVYPSIKPTAATTTNPAVTKTKFCTPPSTTATTSIGAASTVAAAASASHAPPPTAQPTQQFK
ncbi:Uncharacterized protein Fot_21465 [Forsythia ovata]|uniref:Uncharacterized protein n=1 Tax=Forsythia ovata TaxID=205694 RepID=A0ABD1UUX5_9LAMI